jgi:hypothetical protein
MGHNLRHLQSLPRGTVTSLKACLITAVVAAVAVFFSPGLTRAQWLQLGERQGSVESVTEYLHEDLRNSLLQREILTLRNSGAILDPRLVNFTFGGSYGYYNSWATGDNQHGAILDYDFSANILPQKPFSFTLFTNRSQNFYSREMPGVTQILNENIGGTLVADALYIPSSLRFRREYRDEESRGLVLASSGSSQKNLRNVLTYEGLRGWLNSELELHYELTDDQNLSNSSFGSFASVPNVSSRRHDAALNYSVDFGPELNRTWDSRIRFLAQTGFTDLTTLNINQWLRIEHQENFLTNYRYAFTDTKAQDGSAFNHDLAFGLEHHLYRNLVSTFETENDYQTLPAGSKEMLRNNLNFTYTKRLPLNGQLNAGLGGGLSYETDKFNGSEGFAPQETHTALSPFALPMSLNNPLVNPTSVVVTKTAVGPLPAGCVPPLDSSIPLVAGRDYLLQTVGNVTEIKPLPCFGLTSGINPGDTIAVDYHFSLPSSPLAFTTSTWHANFSLDYGWIRPYFTYSQINQTLVSGSDSRFLNDERSNSLGIEFRFDSQRLHSRFLGEGQGYASTRTKYQGIRFNQIVGVTFRPDLTLMFNADEAFTTFTLPRRRTWSALGTATLSYSPTPTITADLFAVLSMLNDNTSENERSRQAGLRLRWYYRKLEILPTIEFLDRSYGYRRTMNYHGLLTIIRRF